MKPLKVLISAYACSPVRGSEPGMGWNFINAISQYHDITVIVEKEKFEEEILKEINARPELYKNIKFYFIVKKRRRTLRKIWPPSYYWYYRKWQRQAYELAKKLHGKENFDIIHQLNMVGFREPGYLWKLDAPFVWGPIGGMQNISWRMLFSMDLHGCLYYSARNFFNYLDMHFMRRPLLAARKAGKALIAATPDVKKHIKKYWQSDSEIICEIGPCDGGNTTISKRKKNVPLEIVWSGLHIGRKALPLLIRALSLLPKNIDWELHIIGEGPLTKNWKKLAGKLNLNQNCLWHGWLKHHEAFEIMNNSDVMVISSLLDLTSTVTLEALSCGVPIVCLDHCGFAHVVDDSCGIKIPVTNPRQIEEGIAAAIEKLYENESLRRELATGAIKRIKEFSWDRKMKKLNDIYLKAIQEHSENSNRT